MVRQLLSTIAQGKSYSRKPCNIHRRCSCAACMKKRYKKSLDASKIENPHQATQSPRSSRQTTTSLQAINKPSIHQLTRCIFQLSHLQPASWPVSPIFFLLHIPSFLSCLRHTLFIHPVSATDFATTVSHITTY